MNILSFFQPNEVFKIEKLPSKLICGHFKNESTDPEQFEENKEFVEYMHNIIATQGVHLPSLISAAERQTEGYLYIIDFRTPEGIMGNVPLEDVVGSFKVENKKVVKDFYWQNEEHKIFTKNGLTKLPEDLFQVVLAEMRRQF